jgi:hypothetical protein
MHLTHEDMSTRLFSPRVWRGFAPPTAFSPTGSVATGGSGNPAFGFFDDCLASLSATTAEGPYAFIAGANASVAQIADTATEKGLIQGATTGAGSGAANEEACISWARGLGAPFKLADKDLAFEARLTLTDITAAKFSVGIGLGEVGMQATDAGFVDTTGVLADKNFCGFVSLLAEAGVFDGAYKADGQTYQDGATKTKLNALATVTAGTYVKLGMRYRAHPKMLEWYVDGAALNTIAPARLTASELDAVTFPDDVFVAPTLIMKDVAGDTNGAWKLDWWACAQYE